MKGVATMCKPITDDQMRSLWRRRCQARKELDRNGGRRPIRSYSPDERATMERLDREIDQITVDITEGLRQRGGLFWVEDDFPLALDDHGDMVPLWPMRRPENRGKINPDILAYANQVFNAAVARHDAAQREAVAC